MNEALAEVIISHDGAFLVRQPLPPGEYLIGRDAECALCVEDAQISARHARLRLAPDGAAIVEDLGSANGTFLEEQPISGATPWPPGARLRLGATVLTLNLAAEPPTIPASLYTPPSPAPLGTLNSASAGADGGSPLQRQLRLTTRQAQRLEVGYEVARGGMGAVRTAREGATRRTVAMKVMLRPESAPESARFISEARITARLEHPNIVPIYELGVDEHGKPFYTMKMVEGITLLRVLQLLKEGVAETVAHYPLATLLTIFQKLCDALAFAHARGVIHRDLKPANIMLGKYGEVLVMDWGLAKIVNDEGPMTKDEEAETAGIDGSHSSLDMSHLEATAETLAGAILGTPQYMSPEQARGEITKLDAHSDIFALGAILYEVLTLERAFPGQNPSEIIRRIAGYQGAPLPLPPGRLPHLPGGVVPESLAAVVRKAMAPNQAQRYGAVGDLQRDLEAYQNGFATSAENAGLGRQIRLLIKRHKGIFGTLAAAWLIIMVLAGWFVINLHESERKAMRNERKALFEREIARRALAQSQITMADEAFRRADVAAMVLALEACPKDLRDQSWQYLSAKRDASLGDLKIAGFETPACLSEVPGQRAQFALANTAGDIAIVNVATGKVLRTIKTGRTGIKLLTFSGDGRQVAVGRNLPAQVEFYDTATGARRNTIALPGTIIHHFALARDGTLFAAVLGTANEKMDLVLFDVRTGALRWKRGGQFGGVLIHPDGDRLMVIGNGHQRFFALLKGQDGSDLSRISIYAFSQALSPDGKIVAVGTQTGDLLMVDPATGTEIQRGKLHANMLRGLAWTPDGHLLTMGSEGKLHDGRWVLKLWNADDLSPVASFFGMHSGTPKRWSLNAESGHLLTEENPPRLWRIPVGQEAAKLAQSSDQAWSSSFLSDNVVLARKAFALTRYDLGTPGRMTELPGTFLANFSVCASHWPAGLFALAKNTGGDPFALKIYAFQGAATPVEKLNKPVSGHIRALDFDGPGERIAAVFQAGGVLVYSVKSGEMLLKVPGRFEHAVFAGGERNLVALNARTLTTEEMVNDLVLLDGVGGQTLATVTNRFRVDALATSPGRAIVATGGTDQAVHIYDAATLQERLTFRAHDGDIGALAFHPSAPIIASASVDGSVKLWDYRSARLLGYYLGLGGMPTTLSFSPNGRLLLVDGQEKTTHVYDVSQVKAP